MNVSRGVATAVIADEEAVNDNTSKQAVECRVYNISDHWFHFLYFQRRTTLQRYAKDYYWRSTGWSDKTIKDLVSYMQSFDMHCQPCTPSSGILADF